MGKGISTASPLILELRHSDAKRIEWSLKGKEKGEVGLVKGGPLISGPLELEAKGSFTWDRMNPLLCEFKLRQTFKGQWQMGEQGALPIELEIRETLHSMPMAKDVNDV